MPKKSTPTKPTPQTIQSQIDEMVKRQSEIAREIEVASRAAAQALMHGDDPTPSQERHTRLMAEAEAIRDMLPQLQGALADARRDDLIDQYRALMHQRHESLREAEALQSQIDDLNAQLSPLVEQHTQISRHANTLGEHCETILLALRNQHHLDPDQVVAVRQEVGQEVSSND